MQIYDLPKDKHKRYFEIAHTAALLANGIGGNIKHKTNDYNNRLLRGRFRLGAVIVNHRVLLSIKNNSGKTHPALLKYTKWPHLHAESNAILSLGLDNCDGASLYVLRILRNKDLGMAKPCSCCMKLIYSVGIRNIFYTTSEGYQQLCLR